MEPKRLTRTRSDRMIAGVCGGLAKYMSVDPTIVRLIFALITFFTFIITGIIIYLVMWIIIPKEPEITVI